MADAALLAQIDELKAAVKAAAEREAAAVQAAAAAVQAAADAKAREAAAVKAAADAGAREADAGAREADAEAREAAAVQAAAEAVQAAAEREAAAAEREAAAVQAAAEAVQAAAAQEDTARLRLATAAMKTVEKGNIPCIVPAANAANTAEAAASPSGQSDATQESVMRVLDCFTWDLTFFERLFGGIGDDVATAPLTEDDVAFGREFDAFRTAWETGDSSKNPLYKLPKIKAKENAVVHPYMWEMLRQLAKACRRDLPGFNELRYQTTTPKKKRPDLVIAAAREQKSSLLVAAFLGELKRFDETPNSKFCEGIVQLLGYLFDQREMLAHNNTHAVGFVSDGLGVLFVGVDYAKESIVDGRHRVSLSPLMPLRRDALFLAYLERFGEAAPRAPHSKDKIVSAHHKYLFSLRNCKYEGARMLLRMLRCTDAARFGLPADAQMPGEAPLHWPGLTYECHLGHGGFGIVSQVALHGATHALKFTLNASRMVYLKQEFDALRVLAEADVPGVPRLVGQAHGAVWRQLKVGPNEKRVCCGLLFEQVGETLSAAMARWFGAAGVRCASDTIRRDLRTIVAGVVVQSLWDTLTQARERARRLHLDVRPTNVLVVRPPAANVAGAAASAAAASVAAGPPWAPSPIKAAALAAARTAMENVLEAALAMDMAALNVGDVEVPAPVSVHAAVKVVLDELTLCELILNDWGASETYRPGVKPADIAPRPFNAVLGCPPFLARKLLTHQGSTDWPGACKEHDDTGLVFSTLAIALGPPPTYPEGRAPWEGADMIFSTFDVYADCRRKWFTRNLLRAVTAVKGILRLSSTPKLRLELQTLFHDVIHQENKDVTPAMIR
jgi:hypothetical protein